MTDREDQYRQILNQIRQVSGVERAEEMEQSAEYLMDICSLLGVTSIQQILALDPTLFFSPLELALRMFLSGIGTYRQACIDRGVDVSLGDQYMEELNDELKLQYGEE